MLRKEMEDMQNTQNELEMKITILETNILLDLDQIDDYRRKYKGTWKYSDRNYPKGATEKNKSREMELQWPII